MWVDSGPIYCRWPVNTVEGDIKMDSTAQTELEAAVFRRLIEHLGERKDVQNIELMILAGFCRNA